jgi:hypothetical protein
MDHIQIPEPELSQGRSGVVFDHSKLRRKERRVSGAKIHK